MTNDTNKIALKANRVIGIVKTIAVDECRTPLDLTMSTVVRRHVSSYDFILLKFLVKLASIQYNTVKIVEISLSKKKRFSK